MFEPLLYTAYSFIGVQVIYPVSFEVVKIERSFENIVFRRSFGENRYTSKRSMSGTSYISSLTMRRWFIQFSSERVNIARVLEDGKTFFATYD